MKNEITTFIPGTVPTDPRELKDFIYNLDAAIGLVRKVLNKKGIEPSKYKEILGKGQEWAELKLRAELRLKDVIESIPKNVGGNVKSKNTEKGTSTQFDQEKNKLNIIEKEFGITEDQYKQIKKLTPYGVDTAISESKEEGDIPTRYGAIKWSKLDKDKKRPSQEIDNLLRKIKGKNKIIDTSLGTVISESNIQINIKASNGKTKYFSLVFDDEKDLNSFYRSFMPELNELIQEKKILKSPFNYVGGKGSLIPVIIPYLKDKKTIVSPFLGGGALEINLANRGIQVIGYDYNIDIVNLWEQIQNKNALLKRKIKDFIKEKIKMSNTEEYQQTYKQIWEDYFTNDVYTTDIEKAAIYWILLMGGFGAKVESKSAGLGIFRNLHSTTIDRRIEKYNITLGGRMSFEESIDKHKKDFLYCDPPYAIKGRTHYGVSKYNPELHEEFDHENLARILNKRKNWILSYNNIPEIKELYRGHTIKELEVPYKLGNRSYEAKQTMGKELLIFG
jgi:DNA adenine methylase